MNYWLSIKDKFNDQIVLGTQLLVLLLCVYVFILAEEHVLWKAPLIFVGLLSWYLLRDKTDHPILLILGLVLLIIDLCYSYYWVANHHFMLLFVVLAVILYVYHQDKDIFLNNIQLILVIVILTSVIQKLLSSQFMSGDFYYYMINRGALFRFFINFFPDSLEVVKSNQEQLLALHDTNPNIQQSIVMKDIIPNLGKISVIYAWLTVIIESFIAFAMLWKSRNTWTHLLLIVMILGILCARFETGFMALLAVCGMFLCNNVKLRLFYVIIFMACIAFIVTKIGYH
ncbi:hypothetical protein [Winogradskyella sp. A2]|uniref:hypothetical protein n=1 Tax=Winogradskyella sp. A2 TaxID=3366944 RepID=UPI00398C341A